LQDLTSGIPADGVDDNSTYDLPFITPWLKKYFQYLETIPNITEIT